MAIAPDSNNNFAQDNTGSPSNYIHNTLKLQSKVKALEKEIDMKNDAISMLELKVNELGEEGQKTLKQLSDVESELSR